MCLFYDEGELCRLENVIGLKIYFDVVVQFKLIGVVRKWYNKLFRIVIKYRNMFELQNLMNNDVFFIKIL